MTDTARTLAAIKALLADNGTHNISAQDLRDVVESIVNPVAGGGFHGDVQQQVALAAFADPVSIPTATWSFTPFTYIDGDSSPLRASSVVSTYWGQTLAADATFELSAGLWWWAVGALWSVNAVGIRGCYLEHVQLADNNDGIWGAPDYIDGEGVEWQRLASAIGTSGSYHSHRCSGFWRVLPSAAPMGVVPTFYQTSGGNLTLNSFAMLVRVHD